MQIALKKTFHWGLECAKRGKIFNKHIPPVGVRIKITDAPVIFTANDEVLLMSKPA